VRGNSAAAEVRFATWMHAATFRHGPAAGRSPNPPAEPNARLVRALVKAAVCAPSSKPWTAYRPDQVSTRPRRAARAAPALTPVINATGSGAHNRPGADVRRPVDARMAAACMRRCSTLLRVPFPPRRGRARRPGPGLIRPPEAFAVVHTPRAALVLAATAAEAPDAEEIVIIRG